MEWKLVFELSAIFMGVSFIGFIVSGIIYIKIFEMSELWFKSFYWMMIAFGLLLNVSGIMIGKDIAQCAFGIFIISGCAIYSAVES